MISETPFSRVNRRDEQRSRTRARIFEAALAEFLRVGFARASVAHIAREAGVSRPTFYVYFPTKEHVLLELQWNLEMRIVDRFERCHTLRETLDEFVEGLMESEERVGSSELFRDVMRIYARPPVEGLENQSFPVFAHMGRRFAGAAASGELREGLDPVQACHLCCTSVFGYLISTPGSSRQRRKDLHCLLSLFLNGAA